MPVIYSHLPRPNQKRVIYLLFRNKVPGQRLAKYSANILQPFLISLVEPSKTRMGVIEDIIKL
jgi:hypothetical protein